MIAIYINKHSHEHWPCSLISRSELIYSYEIPGLILPGQGKFIFEKTLNKWTPAGNF
jgi:hypothetical protein